MENNMKKIIRKFFELLPDEIYLKARYYYYFGKIINFDNVKTYNEKLQWLKLHMRNPAYSKYVDKILVKEIMKKIIGNEYIIPTIEVWDSPDKVDFKHLPNKFVLKCNHNSGTGMFICKDKSKVDKNKILKLLKNGFEEDYYKYSREWPYKNVKRKIFAETLIEDSSSCLDDYKVLCFHGKAKLIEYIHGRFTDEVFEQFYDTEWNKLPITQSTFGVANDYKTSEPPKLLKKMIELSEIISKQFIHARIDWYCSDGRLYFGEVTFYDGSGWCRFDNPDDDLKIGSWIDLEKYDDAKIK